MDIKRSKIETTAVTRQVDQFYKNTGNIYESVSILSKRANQISLELKEELNKKSLSLLLRLTTLKKCLKTVSRSK